MSSFTVPPLPIFPRPSHPPFISPHSLLLSSPLCRLALSPLRPRDAKPRESISSRITAQFLFADWLEAGRPNKRRRLTENTGGWSQHFASSNADENDLGSSSLNASESLSPPPDLSFLPPRTPPLPTPRSRDDAYAGGANEVRGQAAEARLALANVAKPAVAAACLTLASAFFLDVGKYTGGADNLAEDFAVEELPALANGGEPAVAAACLTLASGLILDAGADNLAQDFALEELPALANGGKPAVATARLTLASGLFLDACGYCIGWPRGVGAHKDYSSVRAGATLKGTVALEDHTPEFFLIKIAKNEVRPPRSCLARRRSVTATTSSFEIRDRSWAGAPAQSGPPPPPEAEHIIQ
ncbi:hypothetical protein BDK51DRAFT_41277 [Blyttiomyces helicus]|uniref:Uncharacterized protein n=1 Tax=Blyttiomyces helicus TaxID=388810 RepID=A0A4P9WMR7_9FUNG|nr:hypothetical protein BDK51DRAFT_41277 [Blyttiomyces helicus]|eukprot:RKO94214.1 hypothetical protein BDK51DRAFT_41277 [Blyttiomyces helicus]